MKTLAAVSDFAFGHYQSAMDQFLLYNINPALVISLYPAETIAGRLHMPRDQWMELFGAEAGSRLQPEVRKLASAEEAVGGKSVLKSVAAAAGLGLVKKGSIDSLRTAVAAGQANKAGSAQVEVVNGQKEEEEIFSEKAAKAPKMDEHESESPIASTIQKTHRPLIDQYRARLWKRSCTTSPTGDKSSPVPSISYQLPTHYPQKTRCRHSLLFLPPICISYPMCRSQSSALNSYCGQLKSSTLPY